MGAVEETLRCRAKWRRCECVAPRQRGGSTFLEVFNSNPALNPPILLDWRVMGDVGGFRQQRRRVDKTPVVSLLFHD